MKRFVMAVSLLAALSAPAFADETPVQSVPAPEVGSEKAQLITKHYAISPGAHVENLLELIRSLAMHNGNTQFSQVAFNSESKLLTVIGTADGQRVVAELIDMLAANMVNIDLSFELYRSVNPALDLAKSAGFTKVAEGIFLADDLKAVEHGLSKVGKQMVSSSGPVVSGATHIAEMGGIDNVQFISTPRVIDGGMVFVPYALGIRSQGMTLDTEGSIILNKDKVLVLRFLEGQTVFFAVIQAKV
jgi:hypothetical protein